MAVLKTRLEWYKDKGKAEVEVLIDIIKITVKIGSELKSNTMTINLKNPFGDSTKRKFVGSDGRHPFQVDDIFKMYAKYDEDNTGISTATGSNDLLFVGDLRDVSSKTADTNTTFTLKCTDRSFNLLNGLVINAFRKNEKIGKNEEDIMLRKEGWTSPLIIQHIIRYKTQTNKKATEVNLVYDNEGNTPPTALDSESIEMDARLVSEGGFIQDNRTLDKDGDTRSDFGTPDSDTTLFPTIPIATRNHNFPLKDYVVVSKPIYECLLQLSQVDMTNTGDEQDPSIASSTLVIKRAMRFYIDELNRFHWFYPTGTIGSDKFENSLDITMGTTTNFEIKGHNLNKTVFEILNFIYFETGEDMNGDVITDIKYDPTSGAPIFKESKRSWPKIADKMKSDDAEEGNITLNKAAAGGYDFPASYSPAIVPAWDTDIEISSDDKYNIEFKRVARERGGTRAQALISGSQDPRWKGKIDFKGHNFTVTDLLQYTSEDGGIKEEKIRITGINHSISKGGWFTSLSIEADEKELEA